MSEKANNETVKKTSWFQGVKAEFKKVIWPSKPQILQRSIAVVAVSVVLGLIIAAIDIVVKFALTFLA